MDGTDRLAVGKKIKTVSNDTLTVKEFIAEGGQGGVYKVTYQGQEKALKWYKKSFLDSNKNIQSFYDNLRTNINKGKPSEEFLWPLDITEWTNNGNDSFGYIMDLRSPEYYDIPKFMRGTANFSSYRKIIDACLHIVGAYRKLHNMGYSYQDLNDGNFFINPEKGRVLICDNDNVAPNGREMGIIGKPRYLAPEVVLGKTKPNTQTDIFSMSIILYILFCNNHPLEGKRYFVPALSPELQKKLYGSEAYFIMDPDPKNPNKPDPTKIKSHKNSITFWKCLPNYIQDIFSSAFSQDSIKNPNRRPSEINWLKALTRFRSEIVDCSCGNEVFTKNGESCKCDCCGKKIQIPFRLVLRDYAIPAIKNTRIYKCQLGVCSDNKALDPVASIVLSKDTGELHIWNKTKDIWNATTPSGKHKKVVPENKIPIKDGIKFIIDSQEIKIEANK